MADLICDGSDQVAVSDMVDAINSKADKDTNVFTGSLGAASLILSNSIGGSLSILPDQTSTSSEVLDTVNYGITNGSNSFGYWTKFPDGSMTMYGTVTHNMSEVLYQTHTLPETFVGDWAIGYAIEQGAITGANQTWYDNAYRLSIARLADDFAKFYTLTRTSVSASGTVYWSATGRWKA